MSEFKVWGAKLGAALILSCAAALGSAFLAGPGTRDGVGRLSFDLCQRLARTSPAPRDFLVLSGEAGAEGSSLSSIMSSKDEALVLRLLAEFKARSLVLAGGSSIVSGGQGELETFRTELGSAIDRECGLIEENIGAFFRAIRQGTIPPSDYERYLEILTNSVGESGARLKNSPGLSSGGSLQPAPGVVQGILVHAVDSSADPLLFAPDRDGALRRLPLATRVEGRLEPSPILAALASWLGGPSIELEEGRVLLHGAHIPGGATKELSIPVDADYRVYVAWPSPGSAAEPRRLPLSKLLSAVETERALVASLEKLESEGQLSGDGALILSRYRYSETLAPKASGPEDKASEGALDEWREARESFFASAAAYFEKSRPSSTAATSASSGVTAADFSAAKELLVGLSAERSALSSELRDCLVFASGVDTGFRTSHGAKAGAAEAYASFAREILSDETPRDAPRWALIGLPTALCLLAFGLASSQARRKGLGLTFDILIVLLAAVLPLAAYAAFRIVLSPSTLVATALLGALSGFGLELILGRLSLPSRANLTVVAFATPELSRGTETREPREALRAAAAFRRCVREAVAASGGVLASCEGALALAYFEGESSRALKALELLGPEARAGIDRGACIFAPRAAARGRGGILLLGPVPDLARRLADMCAHYGSRALATEAALGLLGGDVPRRLIGELEVEATGRRASFYALGDIGGPSGPGGDARPPSRGTSV